MSRQQKLWELTKAVFLAFVVGALLYAYAHGAQVEVVSEVETTPDSIPCDVVVRGQQNWLKLRHIGCIEAVSEVARHPDKPMVLVVKTTCTKFAEGSAYAPAK